MRTDYTPNSYHTYNGGWWSLGDGYAEGWFYVDSTQHKRDGGSVAAAASKMVRSVTIPKHMHPDADPHVIQLLDCTEIKADRVIYVATTIGEDGKDTTKIVKDLSYR
jgi:hypothetical protein